MILHKQQQPSTGAKKRYDVLFFLAGKLMLSAVAIYLFAKPGLLFSFQVDSPNATSSGQIEYVVDVRQASKRILLVKAQIHGLSGSEVAVQFTDSKGRNAEIGKRVTGLSLRRANARTLKIKDPRFSFENTPDEIVEVSYQLKSDGLSNLDKATYLDESRCILQSQDAFPGIEDKNIPFKVSFILTVGWKAITLAKQVGQESYEFLSKKNVVFYLGEATEIRESVNNCAVSLAIEPSWPMASEDVLREIKSQIIYMQNVAGDWPPQSLFAAFFSAHKDNGKAEAVAVGNAESIFGVVPQFISATDKILKDIKYQLAERLIGYFFPSFRAAPESELQKNLMEYLAWKLCLKTRCVTKDEFLEHMAEGFYEREAAQAKPGVLSPAARMHSLPLPLIKLRGPLNFFLIDLALSFSGKENNSLDNFLPKSSLESREPQTIIEGLLRNLRSEGEAAKLAEMLLTSSEPYAVTDLLKPFGLLLERKELPKFDFGLSETFQVVHLPKGTAATASGLRLGDRILAINQNRIVRPTDLFKLRSSLRLGEEAILTIDRDGSILKLREMLEIDTFFRLAVNRLADLDKQKRLAQFLGRIEQE